MVGQVLLAVIIIHLVRHHLLRVDDEPQGHKGQEAGEGALQCEADGVRVDYYGTPTPLNQVASCNVADARLITIKPWERTLIPEIAGFGFEVIDPWRLTDRADIDAILKIPYGPERRDAWRRLNVTIGGNNRAGIDRADMVFAVLDGVDVDSGTAAEIGYAFAKGKPILGYRGDFRLAADNEGSTVNLQVEYFIRQSGGDIVARVDDLATALARIAPART